MPKNSTSIVRRKPKRSRSSIVRIVLHTTEGIMNAEDLPPFFRRVQADSHLAIDRQGDCVRMVPDDEKAWTQAAYNPGSLAIEQCGFARWSKGYWVRHYHHGLYRTVQALARWSIKYGIPLRHSVSHGVCQHKDLGRVGGGHVDCGPGYPLRYVIVWAQLERLRMLGKNRGPRARALKARVARQQRKYGMKPDTKVW